MSLIFLQGCATAKQVAPPVSVVWPAPPDEPRVAYVQTIQRPADLGIKASGFTRFVKWIVGSDTGNQPLVKPFGIAFDEKDNLCLTDTGANAVCYYDRVQRKWHRWSKFGKQRFLSPVSMVRQGKLFYVADSALGRVAVFDEQGKPQFQITNKVERPAGLAILRERLYVADSQRHCVLVFGLDGTYVTEFGRRGNGPGEFNFPTHLAADTDGNLYVTDSMNSRVQIVDGEGKYRRELGSIGDSPGQFSRPKGVAVDSHGHVYVIDALFDNIQVFDREGRILLAVGEAGEAPGQFWLPNGIAISRSNEIFVADSYNHRVQILKYVGKP